MNLLPGQTCFEVPEVEVAVHISEDEGVAFPGDACDAAHAALCERRNPHKKELDVLRTTDEKSSCNSVDKGGKREF